MRSALSGKVASGTATTAARIFVADSLQMQQTPVGRSTADCIGNFGKPEGNNAAGIGTAKTRAVFGG